MTRHVFDEKPGGFMFVVDRTRSKSGGSGGKAVGDQVILILPQTTGQKGTAFNKKSPFYELPESYIPNICFFLMCCRFTSSNFFRIHSDPFFSTHQEEAFGLGGAQSLAQHFTGGKALWHSSEARDFSPIFLILFFWGYLLLTIGVYKGMIIKKSLSQKVRARFF